MTPITRAKLTLTLSALVFFAAGMRSGLEWQRWVGIALLCGAVALRFVKQDRAARGAIANDDASRPDDEK
jgi:hypothetical protein